MIKAYSVSVCCKGVDSYVNIIRVLQRKTEGSFLYDYQTVQQALRLMRSHGYTEVPVVNREGAYLGMIREGDFLWHLLDCGGYEQVRHQTVGTFLQRSNLPALTITATDEQLRSAALQSVCIPVVDDRGMFVGVIRREDIVRYFADKAGGMERTAQMMVTA